MTSKEGKSDPILGISSKSMKDDILMFKDETLKDFKIAERKIAEKYQNLNFEVREKLDKYEQRINLYEAKVLELSKLINTDKTIRDKVDTLMEFKEKVDDTLVTEKIRIDNVNKDLVKNVNRYDEILKDSIIYPGVIGGACKFKIFHELIDYVLTECSQNLTFREKCNLDLKGYKSKLESSISSFNSQINTLLKTTSEYTKTCVKECEDRMKSIYNIYDDRLQDARIENANYAIGLERATEALKKELEHLYVVKKELYEKVDNGILEMKNDNTRVAKLFSGYKKNFNIMEHKFTQLSDFIKDIRFRINMKEDVKRREYTQMSDLINFDKKKKPGFYDGIIDNNPIKKNLGSQLKEYIEGRITADQLFKRKSELSKSVSNNKHNTPSFDKNKRKTLVAMDNDFSHFGEEVKINFVELVRSSLKKRMSLGPSDFNHGIPRKDEIKEEDDDDYGSSKDAESVYSKKSICKNLKI